MSTSTVVTHKPDGSSAKGAAASRHLLHLNELGLLAAIVVLYVALSASAGGSSTPRTSWASSATPRAWAFPRSE